MLDTCREKSERVSPEMVFLFLDDDDTIGASKLNLNSFGDSFKYLREVADAAICFVSVTRTIQRQQIRPVSFSFSLQSADNFGCFVEDVGQYGAGKCSVDEVLLSQVPVHTVSHEAQLPTEFLHPSPENQLVIGFDCEGVNLSSHGTLCIMQLALPNAIYLVDAVKGGPKLIDACKPGLESTYITKVIHDCKRDSEALYFQFGIKLHNVVDTQLAYHLLEEQEGRKQVAYNSISFVRLIQDARYCGISYFEKEQVRGLLRQDPEFWMRRPLSERMIRAAADDVRFLPYIYYNMMEKLNEQSLWKLAARGALCCRCFCENGKGFVDWPPIPSIPDGLNEEGSTLEEEVLSVITLPPGKMGCVIGRKGSSILSIKENCRAEILLRGESGSPEKVFILGPLKQVQKAEAMLRGRISGTRG